MNNNNTNQLADAFRAALTALVTDLEHRGVIWTSSEPWDTEEKPPQYSSSKLCDGIIASLEANKLLRLAEGQRVCWSDPQTGEPGYLTLEEIATSH
jgi:hypothetical protein